MAHTDRSLLTNARLVNFRQEGSLLHRLFLAKVVADNTVVGECRTGTKLYSGVTSFVSKGYPQPYQASMLPTARLSNECTVAMHGCSHAPGTLVAGFERTAARHAERVALTLDDRSVTYSQLNAHANSIARRLLALNLPQGSIVAIWLERSPEMIAAMLGVLKAGHTYLPLDVTYPFLRIRQTLEDAGAAALISDEPFASELADSAIPIVFPAPPEGHAENPRVAVDPSTPAYVIYTSGSTGKPKGVLVSHNNVLRLFDRTQATFQFSSSDVWTMFHSFAFDFSVWEIWGPLLTGARLVLVPFETSRSPREFYRLLATERVTVLNQTPSAFLLLNPIEEGGTILPLALRLVIFGGEALRFSTLRSWFMRHADTRPALYNCYGITETTVHVTLRRVTQADAELEHDSLIGDPIADLSIHLLDAGLMPVPAGAIGELCIGGPGVSLGYLNRPELTAERFIEVNGERLYRSGDLARRRADGELVYLGRRDEQVKISGFRIELGEIEAVIAVWPGVRQVCVVPRTTGGPGVELAAYFTLEPAAKFDLAALRKSLKGTLPAHMLPASYTRLESMPLNGNGKIDRKALPEPSPQSRATTAADEPCSEIEAAVLELVRDVVGSRDIGLQDFFFSVGGHSLLGTQFVMRARQAFGVKLTLRDLFETETIAEIAARLEELILDDIANMSEDEALRLTSAQEQPS